MYFDNDVFIIKSFDDLRIHTLALGKASLSSVSNGIMVMNYKENILRDMLVFC